MKFFTLVVMLAIPILACGQTTPTCCGTTTAQFASLGTDNNFVRAHEDPLPLFYDPTSGHMITYTTSDGGSASAFEVMSSRPTKVYVLMIHEWWGLNEYIEREAEALQKDLGNVNVLALDLYDGGIATTADAATKLMQAVHEDRVRAIIAGAIVHAGKDARIGTIGWCFGGGWSLQASMAAGKQGVACVMYYGMPEKDSTKLSKLQAPVLGIFGNRDAWISPAVVKDFQSLMSRLGKEITVKGYNADHAFANPSNPKFDKKATGDAHNLMLAFFKKHLFH